MKTTDEMMTSLFARREQYLTERRDRKRMAGKAVTALFSACLVVVACFGIWRTVKPETDMDMALLTKDVASPQNSTDTVNDLPTDGQTEDGDTVNKDTAANVGQVKKSGDGSNAFDGLCIPAVPGTREISLVGERITDDEAKAYFEKNFSGIKSALTASGVATGNMKISETGYGHICYDGVEGKGAELRQGFRDYLVHNDGRLIAIITLMKENGAISDCPAFGASWFDQYDAYLKQHAGQELIYLYAGSMEIVLAPDGTVCNPMGTDVSHYLEGIENPYERFYHTAAIYVP